MKFSTQKIKFNKARLTLLSLIFFQPLSLALSRSSGLFSFNKNLNFSFLFFLLCLSSLFIGLFVCRFLSLLLCYLSLFSSFFLLSLSPPSKTRRLRGSSILLLLHMSKYFRIVFDVET